MGLLDAYLFQRLSVACGGITMIARELTERHVSTNLGCIHNEGK